MFSKYANIINVILFELWKMNAQICPASMQASLMFILIEFKKTNAQLCPASTQA